MATAVDRMTLKRAAAHAAISSTPGHLGFAHMQCVGMSTNAGKAPLLHALQGNQ